MKDDLLSLYFITSNNHKFLEISKLFENENIDFVLKQCKIETVEIQSDSVLEVAVAKLKSVKDKVKMSCFVEDAGFFVDFPLNGFPGVYSSYVLRKIGNEGILKLVDDVKNSKAHFKTVIALYFKPHNIIYTFEGEVYGKLSHKIKGKGGFGFDPIFIPDESPNHKTFAELSSIEKNEISHRGKAWKKMIEFIKVYSKKSV